MLSCVFQLTIDVSNLMLLALALNNQSFFRVLIRFKLITVLIFDLPFRQKTSCFTFFTTD